MVLGLARCLMYWDPYYKLRMPVGRTLHAIYVSDNCDFVSDYTELYYDDYRMSVYDNSLFHSAHMDGCSTTLEEY